MRPLQSGLNAKRKNIQNECKIQSVGQELTTPPTTTTLMEVREVREATLVTMAIIRSSWLIRAVSLLGGAEIELGPEEGVEAINAGREG